MNYFCTLHASLYLVISLFIKIIISHPFNTFIEDTTCWQIWGLGKDINPSGLSSPLLPNNKNIGNYTVFTNTVSSVNQRRVPSS